MLAYAEAPLKFRADNLCKYADCRDHVAERVEAVRGSHEQSRGGLPTHKGLVWSP